MEKDVEKIYNDVLDSINCENDDFINSYFENDDIMEEMQGNSMEDDEFYDDWTEEVELEQEEPLVENYVEKIDEPEEFTEIKLEIPTETVENSGIEFNNNDFESLLTSSEQFDNMMIEPIEETEVEEEIVEKEEIITPDELVINEIEVEEIPEKIEEKEEFTTDDLLELIEKTDNSEEFFEKLEDRLDD